MSATMHDNIALSWLYSYLLCPVYVYAWAAPKRIDWELMEGQKLP